MTIDPDKYIVFKRKEFRNLLQDNASSSEFGRIELQDAVVLRLKDAHTAGALYAYAMSLLTTWEILSQMIGSRNDDRAREVSYLKTMEDLFAIHEYFVSLAENARVIGTKNPTP